MGLGWNALWIVAIPLGAWLFVLIVGLVICLIGGAFHKRRIDRPVPGEEQ